MVKRLLITMFFVLTFQLGSTVVTAQTLIFAVHPFLSALELHERFQPLVDEFSSRTGYEVVLQISKDYPTHVEALCSGQSDIAFMGPSLYISARDRNPDVALLGVLNGKIPFLRGAIIVRQDSSLKQLSELKQHSVAFVSRQSTMGFRLACHLLHKAGISLDDLSAYAFLGNHQNVAFAVLAGKFDAGSVKYEAYEQMSDMGLRVLAEQPKVADHAFVACPQLKPQIAQEIKKVLHHLHESDSGAQILRKIRLDAVAIRPACDEDYDSLRLCTECLKAEDLDADNE
ncbi:phosphate/phosphite/phosphonate ABC transporter substrate-binding protein [uncultured Desulfuromonas sp.]|uniref:phosphate/phosphite/phosphonate ABC transporter substrate-binding protein n=1 Tax=uncultured Desulfuromonas sp. TaxID=181013 RepID=UPI002AABB745|nr:phosphate/phosphite/phosphonate ABC transporter substrate-binding protein [uncultured Desulfuromonas sp.]